MKASSIRRGAVLLFNKVPHRVMEFNHHTPGNLRAMVQAKLRNLLNGNQTETRFSSTEDIPEADVRSFQATFLYKDSEGYHFMNSETYEQLALTEEQVGDGVYYLMDQMQVEITLWEENPIGVSLAQSVVLEVVDTAPELKGATASNSPKPAKTNTGLSLMVPPFVKIGDKILVSTDEGKYLSRAE